MSVNDTQAPQPAEPVATDTSAPVDTSEAGTQVIEAPEAAQEVKEPVVEATDTAEEKLYAGKYKTVEDMEKAYQELNSKYTNTSQEKAELSRILNEAFATEPVPVQAAEADIYDEPAPSANPATDGIMRDNAVIKFMLAHGDADGEAMKQVLSTDPYIKQITGYEAKLEYAYLRSQAITAPKAVAQAKKEAQAQTQAKIVEKQAAQVESAAKTSAQADEASELKNRMSSGSVAEREAARREYVRKYLV